MPRLVTCPRLAARRLFGQLRRLPTAGGTAFDRAPDIGGTKSDVSAASRPRRRVGCWLACCWLAICWQIPSRPCARAQDLQAVRQRGSLRWGADQEGGGPFVFPAADDPNRLDGFEVELAELIAVELGVKAEFVQGQWDKLPDLLDRGDIDLVLNGYEWTANRAARYGTSIPYYIYELQLLARKTDDSLRSWRDLIGDAPATRELGAAPLAAGETVASNEPSGERPREPARHAAGGNQAPRVRRVAVLSGSAANDYLQRLASPAVEIVHFDGASDAMRAVELGVDRIDANLQDLPVWTFFQAGFPGLAAIDSPVGRGYYVALTRRDDTDLLQAVNAVILSALQDGRLHRIYAKYRMWNATQAARGIETTAQGYFLGDRGTTVEPDAGDSSSGEYSAVRGWLVLSQRGGLLLRAAGMTVLLSLVSMPLAVLLGLCLAICRKYGPSYLACPATWYVEIVRGTPLVLQLYVIFFLLPEIGLSIPAFWAAVIGLAVNYSAYEAEIYRAGLQAIPRGQTEAALALGMSQAQTLRRVIIPQATRIVIPPMTNDFIALFKDTAVCSVITVVELSKQYYIQARSTGAIVELGLLTALLYMAMSYPLSVVAGRLEQRLAKERRL